MLFCQIIELQEAAQIYQGLSRGHPSSLHDMNAIVKTWRNRLPVIADDLTHWSDIFTWRQHHYQFIVIHYDSQHENATKHDPAMKPSMVGVHASAQVCCTLPFMKFLNIVRGNPKYVILMVYG